jgi:hypothetical protein
MSSESLHAPPDCEIDQFFQLLELIHNERNHTEAPNEEGLRLPVALPERQEFNQVLTILTSNNTKSLHAQR